ncbi:hypothetical protein, partial [Candidatus Ichthyocystis hellenicum]|uniref:hypothetical protein n=1 Tax=Candidatus Ichthyocystis hellenicum TaxID=1561003 RepID=UPI00158491E9
KSYQCVDDDGGSLTESSDFVRDICYGAVGDLEGFPSCSAVIVGSGKSLLSTCYNESYGIEGIIPELEDEIVKVKCALGNLDGVGHDAVVHGIRAAICTLEY